MIKQRTLQTSLKHRLLTEHSQEIIIFFNQYGNIIECNQVAIDLLDYKEDIYQTPITEIFRKAVKNVNNQLVIHEKYRDKLAETVAYRKNQTCFNVYLRVTVNQSKRNLIGACIAIDLTSKKNLIHELKRTKNELKLLRQTKNEFVANISHELRTPLNGVMGLIENLMETELSPKQVETVNIIHRCCINMNTTINDLLDYTKIASNKLILEQRVFCIRKLIDHIVNFNINRITQKGLKLLVNVADGIPYRVIGDEYRLTQILNNLFSNAIKFTSVGHIAFEIVKTEQTEHEVELFFMIIDTGIGISLEDKDKLFQSFSQIDGSITRRFGGTGLGLSISKRLIEAMHGTITAESEKNKGSNFSFSIRLGIPKETEQAGEVNESNYLADDLHAKEKTFSNKAEETSNFKEIDYIGELLEKANIPPLTLQNLNFQATSRKATDTKLDSKGMLDMMDRLMICIEMGSWLKAENFAIGIKALLPKDNKELMNMALRLVLTVRKEDHDNSLLNLDELRVRVDEVIGWKI